MFRRQGRQEKSRGLQISVLRKVSEEFQIILFSLMMISSRSPSCCLIRGPCVVAWWSGLLRCNLDADCSGCLLARLTLNDTSADAAGISRSMFMQVPRPAALQARDADAEVLQSSSHRILRSLET